MNWASFIYGNRSGHHNTVLEMKRHAEIVRDITTRISERKDIGIDRATVFCDFSIGTWNVPTVWYVLLLLHSYRIRPVINGLVDIILCLSLTVRYFIIIFHFTLEYITCLPKQQTYFPARMTVMFFLVKYVFFFLFWKSTIFIIFVNLQNATGGTQYVVCSIYIDNTCYTQLLI